MATVLNSKWRTNRKNRLKLTAKYLTNKSFHIQLFDAFRVEMHSLRAGFFFLHCWCRFNFKPKSMGRSKKKRLESDWCLIGCGEHLVHTKWSCFFGYILSHSGGKDAFHYTTPVCSDQKIKHLSIVYLQSSVRAREKNAASFLFFWLIWLSSF